MNKELFNAKNQIKNLNKEIEKANKEIDNISMLEFTEEQKKELESETNFIVYLSKTKQGKFIGNEFYVGQSEPYTKITELDSEYRKLLFDEYEDQQLLVLENILYGQLWIESYDQMKKGYYGDMTPIKTSLKVVEKKIKPIIERDFKTVYKNGSKAEKGNESNALLTDLECQVKEMAAFRVPAKVVMSKMSRAFNFENDTMLATADRIIKKHSK